LEDGGDVEKGDKIIGHGDHAGLKLSFEASTRIDADHGFYITLFQGQKIGRVIDPVGHNIIILIKAMPGDEGQIIGH
jgi:hypothetical protein